MLKISNINWLSKSAKEAVVTISDYKYTFFTFCQPCDYRIEQLIDEPIHAFITENLCKSDTNAYDIRETGDLSYKCIAKVVVQLDNLVKIGDVWIKLDIDIPSWAEEGSFIEFECARLDLW